MTYLAHDNIETDLEKAKDGRWVLLIGGKPVDSDSIFDVGDILPPAVVARWHNEWETWDYAECSGGWRDPIGFVEMSDLGLYSEKPDEAYIDVASDGTAELVHPDGSREPAPGGWNEGGLKATMIYQRPSTAEQEKWLTDHGFFVGERNPRANTNFSGRFMVIDTDTLSILNKTELAFPDAVDLDGGWCVVSDDRADIVWETYSFHCDEDEE